MNLSEVSELKDGDEVEFFCGFPPLTVGEKYKVRKTAIGAYITDDNGIGRPVASQICLEHHFQ